MKALSVLVLALTLLSCNLSQPTDKYADIKKVGEIARAELGKDFYMLYVANDNQPSQLIEELSVLISIGGTKPNNVVVAGPNRAKTERVISKAFEENGETRLPFLTFMYVGAPEGRQAVEQQVTKVGAKFVFKTRN